MLKVGAVIQARENSTRFPNKINQRIGNMSVLMWCDYFVRRSAVDDTYIAMASDFDGVQEWDVLHRMYCVGRDNDLDAIVRVCSDNPFVIPGLINELLGPYRKNPRLDYVSHRIDGVPSILAKTGRHCELVSMRAIKKLDETLPKKWCPAREHVTMAVYTNPHYLQYWINGSYNGPCLTIDTPEDLAFVREWYAHKHNR